MMGEYVHRETSAIGFRLSVPGHTLVLAQVKFKFYAMTIQYSS